MIRIGSKVKLKIQLSGSHPFTVCGIDYLGADRYGVGIYAAWLRDENDNAVNRYMTTTLEDVDLVD